MNVKSPYVVGLFYVKFRGVLLSIEYQISRTWYEICSDNNDAF